ncbi:hypothetical protein PY310_13640 [Pseudarthrobacter sp. H3Y2-7]|uniref:hypothetical protein n=1 Tax=Pseudarthrobacter naphthalenicus TaxID=3031328 RepID=UPI0023AF9262|nr:hypothetical protein [Pseudarthrobacter sp. H3Y2-7]MDE8669620.1 hypothetical protein [Pseudarthrobacter sp. H3Y2-7]
MDEHSGVRIDSTRIRRIIAESTFTLGFLLIPDPGRVQPPTLEVDDAIAEIRMPGHTDQRFHAVEVSQGTAIYVFPLSSASHAVEVAGMIADAISIIGFTGSITACADKVGRRPRTGRYAYSAAICSVEAALDNDETPLSLLPVKKNLDRWAVGSPAFKGVVEVLAAWARTNRAGPILAGLHFTMSRCEPHQVAEIITRCCEDIGWAELLFPAANGDWYVHFSTEGWIVPGTEIKAGKADALDSLSRLLEDLAPLYDYAAVARVHFGLVTPVSVITQWGLPSPSQRELSRDHAAMQTSVPGIFAEQVLGPEHADLLPEGYWNVTPLTAGRRMFTAPNPEDWHMATMTTKYSPTDGFGTLREANKELLG